ncbi:DUF721 domain-containing protein [Treponema primitia]|uniref:DUF721 domain-containing protein n=1 Tax=Treponema primitia TaxID=88058 RepID=UPI00025554A5|nr:DUF721 domain-containing protein [Treponema primitia]
MKKAGDLLSAFLDERVLNTARGYSELFSSWQSIAGDKLAAHSRIRELEHSVLLIEADHPGWIQILQTREKDLLDALRRRFPDQNITGISFRLSRDPPVLPAQLPVVSQPLSNAVSEPPSTDKEAPAEPNIASGDPYEKISDEHFRETLKRLEESIAAKNEGYKKNGK